MKFQANDYDELRIKFQGWERLLALRGHITLPRERIIHLQFHDEFRAQERIVWRVGGTAIPGLLYAGHFRAGGLPYFLYVQRPKGWPRFMARNIIEIVAMNDADKQVTILLTTDLKGAEALLGWYNTKQ